MSNRAKLFIPIIFFFVMLGLLLFGLGRDPNKVPSALINKVMPEFSLPTLYSDEIYTSEILQDGIFLVNFWATWCPPCHAEHPYLMEISQREKDITLVGINYKDTDADAKAFLEEKGEAFEYNLVDANGKFGIDMGVTGAPETFLVDTSGTIRYRHEGEINHRVWLEIFEPLIAQLKLTNSTNKLR